MFLFDEPLSNLDASLRTQMRLEMARLHERLGATIVYVTHDQVEAMTLGDRIAVFNAGRIEQVGTPTAVYRQPVNRFVAGFLGSPQMNFLPAVAERDAAGPRACRCPARAGWRCPATAPTPLASVHALGVRPGALADEPGEGTDGLHGRRRARGVAGRRDAGALPARRPRRGQRRRHADTISVKTVVRRRQRRVAARHAGAAAGAAAGDLMLFDAQGALAGSTAALTPQRRLARRRPGHAAAPARSADVGAAPVALASSSAH